MVTPCSVEEIQSTVEICNENNIPYFVMGNGSNLLIGDKGMRCVVIKLGDKFANVIIDENTVIAQAGILLSKLSKKIMAKSLKGFEFADGIPGTQVYNNECQAYGGEMKDIVKS